MQVSVPAAEAVLNALRTEVVILDRDGRIVAYNEAWQDFGNENHGPATDWRGQDYLQASVGPEGGDAARIGIQEVLDGKRASFELEYPCHSPDEERWFEMVVTRLEDLVVIAHENVTSRHQAERFRQRLWRHARMVKEQEERDRSLQRFLQDAAREVRGPLESLRARLLQVQASVGASWADIQASLDRMERATQRLEHTGGALTKPFQVAAFPIDYLGQVLEEHAPEAKRRDLKLATGRLDAVVTTDPDILQECVACLVAAAVADCPSGGRVHLDSAADGTQIVVTADAGLGDADVDLWLSAARALARQGSFELTQDVDDARRTHTIHVPAAVGDRRDAGPPRPHPGDPVATPKRLRR